MSILIKRYANRKLYNTETSRYITLKGIAKLLDEGEEVRVIDKETGEDITQVALSQILVDNKRSKEDPSDTLLTQILSRGGDALYGAIKKSVDEASDGLGEFQDRFRFFANQSESKGASDRGFAWDPRSGLDRRSPFAEGTEASTADPSHDGSDPDTHTDQDSGSQETSSESRSRTGRGFGPSWPRISRFPDLREAIQSAVANAVTGALDVRDLPRADEIEALNQNLNRVSEAIERLNATLSEAANKAYSTDPTSGEFASSAEAPKAYRQKTNNPRE